MGESCFIDPSFEAIVGADYPPPTGLAAELLEGDDVLLTWNEPGQVTGEWIHWDDGENYNSIGLTEGGSFLVASRWAVTDLVAYDGMYLTKIAFYPRGATTDYALKVWTGENAGTLVLDQPLGVVVINQWNTVVLTTPVQIDATQELWFGYEVNHPAGEYPAGSDAGPAIAGKGDMISLDGVAWDPLSVLNPALNYNWNLQGWVTPEAVYAPLVALPQVKIENSGDVSLSAGQLKPVNTASFADNSRLALLGYNLWRNGNNIHFVPAPDTFYIDPAVAPGTWEYYVSAVYDEGESFWDGPGVVYIEAKGNIGGLAYDASTNMPIIGAVVTLTPGGYSTETGNNGRYAFTGIPIGYYSVTGTKTGFTPTTVTAQIKYNQTTTADLAMYPSNILQPIPFYEPWNGGNFTDKYWSFDPTPGNWIISTSTGNPAPSAEFNYAPTVTEYSFALVSVGLDARNLTENVTVEFDLYLDNFGNTGLEFMDVDVWDGAAWVNVAQFSNVGSIQWEHHAYNVSQYALGKITKVRFVAHGADSYQINNWDIDNIQVHEVIMATLQGTVTSTATGDPIEGAIISIAGYDPEYTNAQGFYTINVVQGTHTVTASAAGYLEQVAEDVMVEGITTMDFVLEPEPCDPPLNLTGEIMFPSVFDVHLNWDPPTGGGGFDEWIHYDSGENYHNIGLTEGGSFMVAMRFEPDQITPYADGMITQVKMFVGSTTLTTEFVLKIWTGPNAATLILDQPLSGLVVGDWNTITLTTPIPIDVSQELWIGYACNNTITGEYPAGCDQGPAVAGYGDMITMDGVVWDALSVIVPTLNYNWNIQAHVQTIDGEVVNLQPITQKPITNATGTRPIDSGVINTSPNAIDQSPDSRSLLGYNVYRDGVKINTSLVMPTYYNDLGLEIDVYTYYVTAQYTLCESEPSNEVSIIITGINDLTEGMINVYPVPAKDYVNVEVSDNVRELRVVNYVGQIVLERNIGQAKSFQLNTSTLSSGSYMIEFTSEDGSVITRRIVINR
jgi:hypothetical protein